MRQQKLEHVLLRNNQTSGEASGGDAIIHAETIENDGSSTSDLGEETNVVSKDDRNTTMLSKSDTENIIHPTETDIPKNEESLKIIDESQTNAKQTSVHVHQEVSCDNLSTFTTCYS